MPQPTVPLGDKPLKYSYEYLIDKKNRIMSASHNFFFFAHKNEAPELTENTVVWE